MKKEDGGGKNPEEEMNEYVLSWKSRNREKKFMHSKIQIENGEYKINRTKFPSFPELIDSYMMKPEDDKFHLSGELENPEIAKPSKNRHSRDSPESLSWYHGKVGNQVF